MEGRTLLLGPSCREAGFNFQFPVWSLVFSTAAYDGTKGLGSKQENNELLTTPTEVMLDIT